MAAPSDRMRAAAAASVLAIVAGLVAGTVTLVANADNTFVSVPWPSGTDATGARCMYISCRATSDVLALFHLKSSPTYRYVRARPCAFLGDATETVPLPSNMDCVEDTDDGDFPWQPGWGQLDAWVEGAPADPNIEPCACGSGCEELQETPEGAQAWVSGRPGVTYKADHWRSTGSNCFTATCIERAGFNSLPEACQ